MSNIFLEKNDIETALLLENAIIHDIHSAVAYTDGMRIYMNTNDNLHNLLPNYNEEMQKWLLWHEKYHILLNHHKRYYQFINTNEQDAKKITKEEVNIIMDILVHDQLAKVFPELIDLAKENLAQFRNRNSLGYTFTTNTLEEMLEEFAKQKKNEGEDAAEGRKEKSEHKAEESKKDTSAGTAKGHKKGSPSTTEKTEDVKETSSSTPGKSEHDETDWSKLDDIDNEEFIDEYDAYDLKKAIRKLQNMKIRIGTVTKKLNSLVTNSRERTYSRYNPINTGNKNVILKGSRPGKTQVAFCFDATGSMGSELQMFKEIVANSVPQAMTAPTTWFSGGNNNEQFKDKDGRDDDYYKGQFKDMLPVRASSGYDDDGDRTIELCWQAEQKGYTPIGVTDGGGQLDWSIKLLKELKRTIIVCPNERWIEKIKHYNPSIQTILVRED